MRKMMTAFPLLAVLLTGCGTPPGMTNNCVPGAADSTGTCVEQKPDLSNSSQGPDMKGSSCIAPAQSCNGSCVDVLSDVKNCGSCSNACANTQSCMAGKCVDATAVCNPMPAIDAVEGMAMEKFGGDLTGIIEWDVGLQTIESKWKPDNGCSWIVFNPANPLRLPSSRAFCGRSHDCFVNCGPQADNSNDCFKLSFDDTYRTVTVNRYKYENRKNAIAGTPDEEKMVTGTRH